MEGFLHGLYVWTMCRDSSIIVYGSLSRECNLKCISQVLKLVCLNLVEFVGLVESDLMHLIDLVALMELVDLVDWIQWN